MPGGRAVDVDARISIGTLNGPWRDSAGNSGTFAFNVRTGGSARPLPTVPAAALTPASITSTQLAPAAVGTANIADGSVTPQKLSVPLPRLASSGLTTAAINIPVDNSLVVRTVTLAIPAAGKVLTNASGLYGFSAGYHNLYAWCSISTGNEVETAHYLYARVQGAPVGNTLENVPFAGSRIYSVLAGTTFTANLVCLASSFSVIGSGIVTLQTAQLNALFVPD